MEDADGGLADWLTRQRARADTPAPARRVALTIGDPPLRVGSLDAGLAQRLRETELPLRRHGEGWQVLAPVDASLALIARWLHANGLGGRWRDELLAVTDEQLRPVSVVERGAVRALGVTTFAVHLVVARADGHVWVQQRALNKATDPGQWDTTMGGQVVAGETASQALERETWEEAGLRIAQLQGLCEAGRITVRRPVAEGYMVEHIEVLEATLADPVRPENQDGEVQCFECLSPDELRERLLADSFTLEAGLILAPWLQRLGCP
jgi:8-oxo-dGTP pyrophosphatase MutT (NUDIX family)